MDLKQVTITATPQPGTSNQPYPVGNLPPFVPVKTTIVDTDSVAIAAHATAIGKNLVTMDSAIWHISNKINLILEQQQAISKAIPAIEVALQGYAGVLSYQCAVNAMAASNQIQTNNFNKAVSDDGTVKMPPLVDQYQATMTDAILLKETATGAGIITNYATEQLGRLVGWITGTETYKDATGWISRKLDSLKSSIFPPSATTVSSSTQAAAGAKAK